MGRDGTAGVLAPLRADLSAEKRALAEMLREVFAGLGISVRRYAARRHLDAGTVSRYLNGTRTVPREFVTDLVADLGEQGTPVTAEVEALLWELHRKALGSGTRAHELQRLQDQLRAADDDVREASVQQRVLTDALRARERQLAELRTRLSRMKQEREEFRHRHRTALVAWQNRYEELQERWHRLLVEARELRAALDAATHKVTAAEERCAGLERELEFAERRLSEADAGFSLIEALETADRTASVPQLVELVTRLNTPARRAMGTELVKSAAQARPVEEAAALIKALYDARQHRHAEAALPAMVVVRPVHDTAALIAEFAAAGLDPAAAAVIQTALEIHSPGDVAVIASALWARGLTEHITAVLGPAVTVRPVEDVMETLWALESLEASELAGPAMEVCARQRSVWEIADLVGALEAGGFGALARLLQDTVAAERPAKDVIDLVDALRRHGMWSHAEHTLYLSTESHAGGHVAALVDALNTENLQDLAAALLARAVREWPVEKVATLIVALHEAGDRHHASEALTDAARILSAQAMHALIQVVDRAAQGGAQDVLAGSAAGHPHELAALIGALDGCGFPEYADFVFWRSLSSRTTGHAAQLVGTLRWARSPYVSERALARYADTRPTADLAALSLALDAAGLHGAVHTFLVGPGTPRARTRLLALLSALDATVAGARLAEGLLRAAAREFSVDENVELALALDSLPLKQDQYERVFFDETYSRDWRGRSEFVKKFKARKKELKKELEKIALENVRRDRKNRHRKVAGRITGRPGRAERPLR